MHGHRPLFEDGAAGFDVVIAVDTLWNPDLHGVFIETLRATLGKWPDSGVHIIVGLHTRTYTI